MRRPDPQPAHQPLERSASADAARNRSAFRRNSHPAKDCASPAGSETPNSASSPSTRLPEEHPGRLRQNVSPDAKKNRLRRKLSLDAQKHRLPKNPSSATQRNPKHPSGSAPGLGEDGAGPLPKHKRRRLPSLQEVLDAFEPEDEYLEPQPEPGDFWTELDDWPME
ncbi:MAG: hypothetical protein NZ602_05050 [Thermoguttaceae bacterium]|nr:hypothetical protein [Thermoguttaceae bacterium]MDW8039216.1 hypothetical protein [Thermoguttaceae bacterium]